MTTITIRPQALGIYPLPAGYLVLPDAPGVAEYAAALLAGHPPTDAPAALHFYAAALHGDVSAALAALADDATPEARYNRCVLGGDQEAYTQLRAQLAGELAPLLDLVAYTAGWNDTPPDAGTTTGELRAALLAGQAAFALEQENATQAQTLLTEAVAAARPVSPLLAAQLLGDLAEARTAEYGADGQTLRYLQDALRLLEGTRLTLMRGQFALKIGLAYHERARGQREPLLEAVKYYQDALQHLTRQQAPELYALAQNNLALAYLAMPMVEASDQLRMGLAVQALREALKVYTRAAYPEQWASTQLNLANALQYLPSSHPEDNLVEAVQLYEEITSARNAHSDPLGYARLLANQGNALAHLGIMDHARTKLEEAATLFTRAGDPESAASVRTLLNGELALAEG